MGSTDFTRGDPVPRLGPFANRPVFFGRAPALQRHLAPVTRRPFQAEMMGLQTRQDRLRIPYYEKPVQMDVQSHGGSVQAASSGIVQSIKTRVSNLFSRLVGRPSEDGSELN